jgi:hypothetical protein
MTTSNGDGLHTQARIVVEVDDERYELYNEVEVDTTYLVTATETETLQVDIWSEEYGIVPWGVTHWVAQRLREDLDVDVEDHGIAVVDPTADHVRVVGTKSERA